MFYLTTPDKWILGLAALLFLTVAVQYTRSKITIRDLVFGMVLGFVVSAFVLVNAASATSYVVVPLG